jgi:plasmid stabilization system protein ParE
MPGAKSLRSSMAAKRMEIHPAALEELKSAVAWYLERSESAALKFISAVDQAIDLVHASPQ